MDCTLRLILIVAAAVGYVMFQAGREAGRKEEAEQAYWEGHRAGKQEGSRQAYHAGRQDGFREGSRNRQPGCLVVIVVLGLIAAASSLALASGVFACID